MREPLPLRFIRKPIFGGRMCGVLNGREKGHETPQGNIYLVLDLRPKGSRGKEVIIELLSRKT